MAKDRSVLGRQYSRMGAALVGVIVVVALNQRSVLTAVGPVTTLIQEATGLDTPAMGLLASVPVLCMGLGSLVAPRFISRVGMDYAVTWGLVLLGLFTLMRSFLPGPALWIGTVGIGLAIGVLNTTLPPIIKRDFPTRSSTITGIYSATLTLSAGVASGVAVPIAGATSWRVATGVWIVFVGVGLTGWIWSMGARGTLTRRRGLVAVSTGGNKGATTVSSLLGEVAVRRDLAEDASVSVWRSGLAWAVTAFMGTQSLLFYLFVQWLPRIEQSNGVSQQAAGFHMTLFQITGLFSTLLLTSLQGERADQRPAAVVTAALWAAGLTGMLMEPEHAVVWAMIMGAGSGASFALALSFISTRTRHSTEAARLSGMSQSFGYFIASFGPTLAGWLGDARSWNAVLVMALGLSGLLLALGLVAGAPRKI